MKQRTFKKFDNDLLDEILEDYSKLYILFVCRTIVKDIFKDSVTKIEPCAERELIAFGWVGSIQRDCGDWVNVASTALEGYQETADSFFVRPELPIGSIIGMDKDDNRLFTYYKEGSEPKEMSETCLNILI